MSDFLERIRSLIGNGDVRISEHGYDELADDRLTAREAISGIYDAVVVEEYPEYPKGTCILVLEGGIRGQPIVVWGIPRGHERPAVLVTAYRPDPGLWDESFTERRWTWGGD